MKKILSISLIFILLLGVLAPITSSAEQITNSNITTSFDETTGTLTVSGFGKVQKLYYDEKSVDNKIKHIVISEGITEVNSSFNGLNALQDIAFPTTLEQMNRSFNECNNLESVTMPEAMSRLYFCFTNCDKLKGVTLNPELFIQCSFNFTAVEEIFVQHGSTIADSFNSCKNLKKAFLDKDVYVYGTTKSGKVEFSASFSGCNNEFILYSATTRENKYCRIETPVKVTGVSESDATDTGKNDKETLKQITTRRNNVLICLIVSVIINTVLLVVLIIIKRKKQLIKNDDNYEENN